MTDRTTHAQVPCAATLFCQPLQLRRAGMLPAEGGAAIDVSAANGWHWRPDYEGIELGLCRCDAVLVAASCVWQAHCPYRNVMFPTSMREMPHVPVTRQCLQDLELRRWVCREDWTALGPVVEAFCFDFTDWRTNMAPAEMRLRLPIGHDGVWNAVAFWFELELDEEASLSTSPYADKACHAPASDHRWRDIIDLGHCASDTRHPVSKNVRQCACGSLLGVRSNCETCVCGRCRGRHGSRRCSGCRSSESAPATSCP